uniref:Uncharacterized protein n=1 Tax=Anguilla anguilla TaxID=7936 RepID=A0A0E9SLT4_ANGAN
MPCRVLTIKLDYHWLMPFKCQTCHFYQLVRNFVLC